MGDNLKRIYFLLLTVIVMLGAISSNTISYAKSGATLTASSVSTEKEAAAVTISLNGNTGIWGIKFKVDYDHSALTLSSVNNGNVFSSGDVTMPDTLEKDDFVYFASSSKLKDVTTNGAVVTLDFKVVGGTAEGTYPIKLSLTQAINVDGKNVDIEVQDGAVAVAYDVNEDDVVFDKSKDEPLTILLETGGDIKTVEIDGTGIEQGGYKVDESGNVVISAEYMNSLDDGRHKVSIVNKKETMTTHVVVKKNVSKEPNTEAAEGTTEPAPSKESDVSVVCIVAIVCAVALGLIAGIIYSRMKKRRKKI